MLRFRTSNSFGYDNGFEALEWLSDWNDYWITQNWWTFANGNCSGGLEPIVATAGRRTFQPMSRLARP